MVRYEKGTCKDLDSCCFLLFYTFDDLHTNKYTTAEVDVSNTSHPLVSLGAASKLPYGKFFLSKY